MARNKVNIDLTARDKTGRAFKRVDSRLARLNKSLGGVRARFAMVGAALGGGLAARNMSRSVDQLQKMALRLGTTTEALSKLNHVAELSGISTQTMNMGLQRMVRRVAEAAAGTGEAKKALEELGISAKALNSLAIDQQFMIIAEALNSLESNSDKVRLAMKLFDSEGVSLIQTMGDGAAGVQKMASELETLGGVVGTKQAKAIADSNDAWTRFKAAISGVGLSIQSSLTPAITALLDHLTLGIPNAARAAGEHLLRFTHVVLLNLKTALDAVSSLGFGPFVKMSYAAKKASEALGKSLHHVGLELVNLESAAKSGTESINEGNEIFEALTLQAQNAANSVANYTANSAKATVATTELGMKAVRVFDRVRQTSSRAASTVESQMTTALMNAGQGFLAFGDLAMGVLRAIAEEMIRMAIVKPIAQAAGAAIGQAFGLGGMFGPNTGGFSHFRNDASNTAPLAHGGPAMAGKPYLVGERGPELMVPNSSGTVIPNNELGGATNVTLNITTGIQSTVRAEIMQMMPMIANNVKQAVAESRMRGGQFSSAMGV
jgi:uncharacterized protein Yka (UPF0111/DUF47 family)